MTPDFMRFNDQDGIQTMHNFPAANGFSAFEFWPGFQVWVSVCRFWSSPFFLAGSEPIVGCDFSRDAKLLFLLGIVGILSDAGGRGGISFHARPQTRPRPLGGERGRIEPGNQAGAGIVSRRRFGTFGTLGTLGAFGTLGTARRLVEQRGPRGNEVPPPGDARLRTQLFLRIPNVAQNERYVSPPPSIYFCICHSASKF